MSYIVETVEDFFAKLDRMQQELAKFSQKIDDRSEKIPVLLRNFEKAVFAPSEDMKLSSKNAVDKAAQNSLANLRTSIESWRHKTEQDRKGREFIQKNEEYLVVMIFGAVKAGKSSLGNFFAGQKFLTAPFDNPYKHISPPEFETEEQGRNTGDVEKDENGNIWFSEGVTDTTGAIQYFTLSGLRWVDSPGTGAVSKEGDTTDMTKLVEKYLPYTDMCIFLMNSSEPGLQEDMRYMNELSKQGQEALIVITRSDKACFEKVEGKRIRRTIPKTPENRKLQEDTICKEVKDRYPNIDAEKFRAISISTKLAKEAIVENDDEKYKASNLDKLMQILGNKVSDNAIARKQDNPRRLLNGFIEQILSDLGGINDDLNKMQEAVDKYKNDMEKLANIIVSNVKQEVRIEITQLSNSWNRQVNHGGKFDTTNVNKSISQVVQEKLNKEINRQMTEVIEDYEQQELPHVQANLEVGALEKKTATIKHTYIESYTVERDPDGFWEHVGAFVLGRKYSTIRTREHTEEENVDIGTNIDEFMDDLMPQVEQFSKEQAIASLKMLENNYFHKQEQLVGKMRQEMDHLKDELNKLKV